MLLLYRLHKHDRTAYLSLISLVWLCCRWIRGDPYFASLACLAKLKSLRIYMHERSPFRLSAADVAGFGALRNLESFELEGVGGHLVAGPFPDAFYELPNLTHLAFDFINITGLAQDLGRLTGLTSLSVKFCPSEDANLIAQKAATLRQLISLDLSYNDGLDQLPDLSALRALRTLRCAQAGFRSLPVDELRKLPAVQDFGFYGCSKMEVPESLADLAGLRHLRMLTIQGCKASEEGMRAIGCLVGRLYEQEPGLRVVLQPYQPNEMAESYPDGPRQGNCTVRIRM